MKAFNCPECGSMIEQVVEQCIKNEITYDPETKEVEYRFNDKEECKTYLLCSNPICGFRVGNTPEGYLEDIAEEKMAKRAGNE